MKNTEKKSILDVKGIVKIGVLSAVSTVLMLIEIPLWFAPSFYKIDLSEIPILIGSFALGPIAGILMELIKNLLNLVINGTVTGGIGELANFIIGCAIVAPSAFVYQREKTRKNAIVGLSIGTALLVVAGCLLNYFVLLPVYAAVFHMPLSALVQMGSVVNPAIKDLTTLVLFAVAPFNLLKGIMDSLLTMLIYKKVSPILHR